MFVFASLVNCERFFIQAWGYKPDGQTHDFFRRDGFLWGTFKGRPGSYRNAGFHMYAKVCTLALHGCSKLSASGPYLAEGLPQQVRSLADRVF